MDASPAKINPREISKFCGWTEPRKLIPLKYKTQKEKKMANGRFKLLNEEDLQNLRDQSESKNTKRSTSTWLNAYQSWAKERNKKDLESYTPNELDTV